MELKISDGAEGIIKKLNSGGFTAFVAGGAVRDILRGKIPHDYDIATNALPYEVKLMFKHTIDTGIKHGTVTVVENRVGYEVTTFRTEGSYCDGRHPDSVNFISTPEEDCKRRDFTINSMMYSPKDGLLDFFGGVSDLKAGIIRCVGEPETRFREDALRMLRAVRFSAVLGFCIEKNTFDAISKCAPLISRVSSERILEELNKILLSDNPDYIRELHKTGLLKYIIPQLERCFGEAQRNRYHIYDVGEHIMQAIKNTPPELILRWSALMHDIGKPYCSSTDSNGIIHFYGHHRESRAIAVDVLHRLRMDSDSIRDIAVLVENHDVRVDANPAAIKRMMSRTGERLFEKLLILQKADNMAKNPKFYTEKIRRINKVFAIYNDILAEGQPYMVSQLAVNGRDLMKIGYRPGREIGDTLKHLLDDVIINPALNNHVYLLKRAKELKRMDRRK